MKAFRPYVDSLRCLVVESQQLTSAEIRSQVAEALNGQPSLALRQAVSAETRRATGAFFTGPKLARLVAGRVAETLTPASRLLDPACGERDLLLAYKRAMPADGTPASTIANWSGRIAGRDRHPEFTAAARYRLLLEAVRRGSGSTQVPPSATRSFSNLRTGSGFGHGPRLGDFFDVSIGPVVEHRSPNRGKWVAYLTTADAERWGVVTRLERRRRFQGTLANPPFVVIRRNSRPDDDHRVVPTIVNTAVPTSVGQLVGHEVEAPALVQLARVR